MPSSSLSAPTIIPLTCNPLYRKGKQCIDLKTKIELSCSMDGVSIYYSVNGRQPNPFEKWQINNFVWRYTVPFTLSGGNLCTVKAVAVDEKLKSKSVVVSRTFYVEACAELPRPKVKKATTTITPNATTANKQGSCAEVGNLGPYESNEPITISASALKSDQIICQKVEERDEGINEVEIGKMKNVGNVAIALAVMSHVDEDDDTVVNAVIDFPTEHEPSKDLVARATVGLDEVAVLPSAAKERLEESLDDQPVQVATFNRGVFEDCPSKDRAVVECVDASTQTDMTCILLNSSNEKPEIQHDKSTQAGTTNTIEQSSQTDLPNSISPARNAATSMQICSVETLSKAVGTDLKTHSTSCQTTKTEEKVLAEQSVQTEKCRTFSGCKGNDYLVKPSPGRGYWRKQIDHITTQLKTEAYNNLEFQELISEPCLTKINNVKVHEGLDELVLVISMAIQRPRITK